MPKRMYTQANRRIAITTPLGDDVLLLRSLTGTESISRLFEYHLELLSENDAIDFNAIVGKQVNVRVLLADGSERHWNGFISRFSQGASDRTVTSYHAEIVPWLWFCTRTADCRIFQQKSAPEIIKQIFTDLGLDQFELRLRRSYAPRDYCVQYRESDFNFVSRLMEEEGIFYFFEHDESSHKMIIADDSSAHKPCPNQEKAHYQLNEGGWRDEDLIHEWEKLQELRPGKWAHTDYNFESPSTDLMVTVGGSNPYEIYDYPGVYAKRFDGDARVKIRLQEETVSGLVVHGASKCRAFRSGFAFDLEDHYRSDMNQKYVLTSVHHRASQGTDYDTVARNGEEPELSYTNNFTCIPASVPYRAQRVTPRPRMRGCQTAVVVGPAGEEIYTDQYGRVKVQFHWDREGKRDENSSCWVRVSHPWAGKGWGAVSIPRIGQEVVIDFLEGDPDQPLIVGRVYNAECMPPYGLPGGAVVSGIKSDSTKGSGGYNEMSMDDTKGKEKITIHAQYDMATTVEHDDTQTVVSGDRTIAVKAGKHTETIKGDTAITIETGNHSLTVQTGKHTETIKGDTSIVIQSGTYSLDVQEKTHTHHVKGKVTENYDATQDTTVNGDITIKSKTAKITVEASTEIFLHCGSSMLSMKSDGTIKLEGTKIEISGGDSVKMGVGNQNVTCDKQKVATSGAAINSSAVGMHEITGALVKIN